MLFIVGLLMIGGACKGWADKYIMVSRVASSSINDT